MLGCRRSVSLLEHCLRTTFSRGLQMEEDYTKRKKKSQYMYKNNAFVSEN